MFSYRHAFHAGSHADVLKHVVLLAMLRLLTQKEAALTVIDTHAGAGLYRLDGDYAGTSGEAAEGVFRLFEALKAGAPGSPGTVAPALQDYRDLVASFNKPGQLKIYPGSPFIVHHVLRERLRDRLKLFELHPTDAKALAGNVAQLGAGRQITVTRDDGFGALKPLLPPPSRRALVLIDPSFEIKSDYAKVSTCLQDALKRFSTGVYAVWYPIIPRPEAHDLPRRLRTLATQAGKPWLHATLSTGRADAPAADPTVPARHGLTASGVFVVNPPHGLEAQLREALPPLTLALGQGRGKAHTLQSSLH